MTEKLTALVITYNEIDFIKRCMQSLAFADEIIVVDSFSTDGTAEYLKDIQNVQLIQRPFKNFTDQKQFALDQASHNWVVFLDADEFIAPPLQKEIRKVINNSNKHAAYYIGRIFMYGEKPVFFSGTQTDKQLRLFQKEHCRFDHSKQVHEELQVQGAIGKLKNRLLHYSFKDFETFKGKLLKYGELKGRQELAAGKGSTLLHLWLRPIWKFFINYFVRLGILDGKRGWHICYLSALSVRHRYIYMRQIRHKNNLSTIKTKT
ncbi:MAG: glycosyltransferase family 2 protein [Flavobacteriaceae bacterium]|nr:glycosyltransferase family 2 protein [Flavobacteriaceae bacterium]